MSKDEAQAEERLDIALERIAAEKRAHTGRLDLGNLGLTGLPASLSELDWLEELRLGGVVKAGNTVFRSLYPWWGMDSREETDEAYNPNRIEDLAPSLIHLPRLRILDCTGADLHDLAPWPGSPPCSFSSAGGALQSPPPLPTSLRWPGSARSSTSSARGPGPLTSAR